MLKAATKFGFSTLQDTHQLAQKSIRTYLPLKYDNLIILPSGFCCSKSGAFRPISVAVLTLEGKKKKLSLENFKNLGIKLDLNEKQIRKVFERFVAF